MKKFTVKVNGKIYDVEVEQVDGGNQTKAESKFVPVQPKSPVIPAPVQLSTAVEQPEPSAGGERIKAPLPGKIIKVQKAVGEVVKAGDLLIILEAMKMENEITAPKDGVIQEVKVADGATVGPGDIMMVIA